MEPYRLHSEEHAAVVGTLADAFSRAGRELILVGGYNRSLLLGTVPHDLDFATDAAADETVLLLEGVADRREDGSPQVYAVGQRYGTVGALVAGEPVEITTYRENEEYGEDHRRPTALAFASSFDTDAARRDFTMNAIGYDCLSGGLRDHFGGAADIERGIIRAIGNPADRFREDPLRMLRAARFASQLGFSVEPATLSGMREEARGLSRVAVERVRDELFSLLLGEHPSVGLDLLAETGILALLLPEIDRMRGMRQPEIHHDKDVYHHTLKAVDSVPPVLVLRLAALFHDVGKPDTFSVTDTGTVHFYDHERVGAGIADGILERLVVPNALRQKAVHLVRRHMHPHRLTKMWEQRGQANVAAGVFDVSEKDLRRLLSKMELVRSDGVVLVSAEDVLELNRADILAGSPAAIAGSLARWEQIGRRLGELRAAPPQPAVRDLPVTGGEVVEVLGLDPKSDGETIGRVMAALHLAVRSGHLDDEDAAGAMALARETLDGLRG